MLIFEFCDLVLILIEGLYGETDDLGDNCSVLSRIGDNLNLFSGEMVDVVEILLGMLKC